MGSILQDEVEGLLQSQRYDPSIIPKLEEYVQHQVTIGPYDSDANLALLKLYQFYPELYNAGVVAKVLMLALTALPATDFLCSQYLISSKFQNQEPVPKLVNLLELLEGGKYLEFWASKESYKDRIPAVKDFDKSIRRFMFGVIKRTYIAIEREEFMVSCFAAFRSANGDPVLMRQCALKLMGLLSSRLRMRINQSP
mmetsp:Transcript_45451/g.176756  ORF Transcript_45451/g.176756 Transcript_45451/m.176756 type:complete len:197 (+) Transcript_45451:150-740(+)